MGPVWETRHKYDVRDTLKWIGTEERENHNEFRAFGDAMEVCTSVGAEKRG